MTVRRSIYLRVLAAALFVGSLAAGALAQTPVASGPRGTLPSASGAARQASQNVVAPQGFSVVLVLGDLQAAAGEDDVPPAARKALADMRDFLPYKSYKLLDAAWILCCAGSPVVNRLRGPEDRDYELQIASTNVENARTSVRFALREAAPDSLSSTLRPGVNYTVRQRERSAAEIELQQNVERTRAEAGEIERELRETRKSLEATRTTDERKELTEKVRELQARLADANRAVKIKTARAPSLRAIIDTSFTMDVGETVVVGTSRLTGGSKALIALLTAVPPRSQRR